MEVTHVRHTRHNTNDHSIIIQGNKFKGFNLLNPIYHRRGGGLVYKKSGLKAFFGPLSDQFWRKSEYQTKVRFIGPIIVTALPAPQLRES